MKASFKYSLAMIVTLLALVFNVVGVTPTRAAGNLVGYWTLDDGSGATAADSSGYGHPGALTGGSWSTSHAPTAFANTGSLSLDGSAGQGINATQVTAATDNLSMSAWVNWAGVNSLGQMLLYNGNSGPNGYGIYLQANGELSILNGGVAIAASPTSFKLTVGAWQYVVAMRDAGVWKLYVDGIQVALNANPVPNPPSGQTSIGRSTVTTTNTFNGLIDDARIYDRVLAATETCSTAITVTNNADSGAGSLRQAIAGLCSGGTINFDNDYTVTLASELTIGKSMTIDGAGHSVTVSGGGVTRVMNLTGGTINVNQLTIANGYLVDTSYSGISGAGININGATLNVSNSTFSGNTTGWPGGGGIQIWAGTANVSNCAFIGNQAISGGYGGGIDTFSGTTLNVTNSAFSGNSAASAGGGLSVGGAGNIVNSTISGNSSGWAGGGGGINNEAGAITLKNSIITNNPTGNNCWSHYGDPFNGANNLANDATCGAGFTNSAFILLGMLGNYGGSTQTFPLLPGSAAIDAGDSAICAAAPVSSLDQRGVTRPAACDIGAFESQGFTLTKTGGDNQSTLVNTAFSNPLTLNIASAFGEPVDGGAVTFTGPASGASTNPMSNTATISGGAVSRSLTANGTAGGPYTVVAGAAGAAANVNFSLTNNALTYSLGNRVWFDTNNSGTLNGAEVGVSGVRVELYQDNGGTPGVWDATDTYVGFATTDASGYYRFDNLPAGDYVVKLPAVNFASGNPLYTYWSSGTSTAINGAVSDSVGPDPDNNIDSDDNGVTTFSGNAVNYVSSQAVTLGPGASEPTNDNDPATNPLAGEAPNNQSNRTMDFGFYRAELSNQIFMDANNNGAYDAGDTALSGATVELYASDGTTLLASTVTGAGGTYLFSGLAAGDYIVKVTPPAGYNSTVDTANSGDTTNPNNNIDNNDNGIGTAAGQVSSNIITLTPGSPGAAANNTVTNATGTTANPSLDFGFQTFISTTTGLASSQNPSTGGQSVTFTATIAPAAATGAVTFRDGGASIPGCVNVSVSSGQATCTTSALTLGAHTITAVYSGDATYSGSTGTLAPNQQVNCSSAITVTNNANSGAGSLRQAIADACAGGTITFDSSLSGQTIALTSMLTIAKNMTIDGSALASQIQISGQNAVRVFYVNSGVTATLTALNIVKGTTPTVGGTICPTYCGGGIFNLGILTVQNSTIAGNQSGYGGGIFNHYGTLIVQNSAITGNSSNNNGGGIHTYYGTITMTNSTIADNSSFYGGGIFKVESTLTIQNSTFSGNKANAAGGAIFHRIGTLTIQNSTFSGNQATYGGSGIYNDLSSTLNLANTLIANSTSGSDCNNQGTLAVNDHNLIEDGSCSPALSGDPLLGALGSYGGSTQTFALLPGSKAIDAGDTTTCDDATTVNKLDQRGVARPSGACDIGAFESQGFTLTKTGGDGQSATVSAPFTNPLALSVSSAFGEPVNGGAVTFTPPGSGASAAITGSPATISGGAVSVSATANGIVGGPYNVTASATGATSVNFALTNTAACSAAITVTNNADSGTGTLRQAIADACAGGAITFDNNYTILLASELAIAKDLTIDGGSHSVTVSGNHVTRVFNVTAGTITFNHLTIADGNVQTGDCGLATATKCGGGMILQNSGVTVTVTNSILSGNGAAHFGGGIVNYGGTLNVTNSTFSGNSASIGGGGIYFWAGALNVTNSTFSGNSASIGGGIYNWAGALNVTNNTFSGNSATNQGGGIYNHGTLYVTNSTFSGNSATNRGGGISIDAFAGLFGMVKNTILANNTGGNCHNISGLGTNNLADDDSCGTGFTNSASILLGTLANYGGPTQTIPLLPGSAAIDAGDSATCAAAPVSSLDQRGVARPSACDIGAFESQGFTLTKTGGDNQAATVSTPFTNPLALNVTSSFSEPVNGGKVTFTPPASGASAAISGSPATVGSGGVVSVTATANGTIGGPYNVAASAAGATSVNFALTNLSSAKAITAFSFSSPAATGVIDETAHTIALSVPYGTNVTALVPSITHTGASVSPNSGVAHDFTSPVTYTVTAADASTQTYVVTVDAAPAVTAFTATSPTNSLVIPITAFNAADDKGVTGYLITTSATQPSAFAAGWSGTIPTTYTVAGSGTYQLYPWAKDAAGNVSAVFGTPPTVVVYIRPTVLADFNGDGKTEVSIYRPGNAAWYVNGMSTTYYGGLAGDIPVPGDYNGDRKTEIAIYRPNGAWYINGIGTFNWGGMAGDIPVPADYNGDGVTEIAIYRPNGAWYINGIGTFNWGGMAGDIPVPADYNGDGVTEIAIYRSNGAWYIRGLGTTYWGGVPDDIPVPADYNGDGLTDIAIYRPGNAAWYINGVGTVYWGGVPGDTPVPGDYNADGVTEIAIYRSNAAWYIRGVGTTYWGGVPGDFPLPARDTNGDGDPYQ